MRTTTRYYLAAIPSCAANDRRIGTRLFATMSMMPPRDVVATSAAKALAEVVIPTMWEMLCHTRYFGDDISSPDGRAAR